jgi:hypothetical protein
LGKSIFNILTIILLLAGPFQCPLAAGQKVGNQSPVHVGGSGFYDTMVIGVNKEKGEVTGFFSESTGWDQQTKAPSFSCIFYIYGKLQGDAYQVTTWYPSHNDYIKGKLKFVLVEGRREIDLKLDEEHGGCWNVRHFAKDADPMTLTLEKRGDWISVKVVSAKKAFFYKGPNEQMKGRAYLVRHDPVRVLKAQAGWVEAEYGDDKVTRGWIKESDLFTSYPNTK